MAFARCAPHAAAFQFRSAPKQGEHQLGEARRVSTTRTQTAPAQDDALCARGASPQELAGLNYHLEILNAQSEAKFHRKGIGSFRVDRAGRMRPGREAEVDSQHRRPALAGSPRIQEEL